MSSVVIIGPAHPLRGGLASFDERLAREFQNKSWSTLIYTFSLQYPGFLFPGTTQFSSEPKPEDLSINVCINSINPFNWLSIGLKLKKHKPDLIIVRYWLPFMGPCLGTILRIAKKNRHTKIICIADNVIPHEKRPGDSLFNHYFLKVPDAFVTMGESVMHALERLKPSSVKILTDHPLYDNFGEHTDKATARKELNLPDNIKLVLFFGFIRKYKGLDLLLDAFADKKLYESDIHLLIAGEFYEDSKPYLDQIEQLKLKEKIFLHTHFIPDSRVRYYLSAADVVVQPYKNATQSGVTPLAYHFEKPMIVTRVGALARLVPHDSVGLVCEPDPESIAASILEFFKKPAGHFIPGLLEGKAKLSWSAFVDKILNLFHDIQK
jgi:glycosyltransferase involved in cell wall biosynthesis